VAALVVASTAQAAPLTFNMHPVSSFTLSISAAILGSGSNSGAVTGSLDADQDFGGGNLMIAPGASGAFSVADFSVTGLLFATIDVKGFGLTVTNQAGAAIAGPKPHRTPWTSPARPSP
jgi:hypothetical protein